MNILTVIQQGIAKAVKEMYGSEIKIDEVAVNSTRKEFEGDYTVVMFPFSRIAKKKPEIIGEEVGAFLVKNEALIESYNVINGFLNLGISQGFWKTILNEIALSEDFGQQPLKDKKVMVEFSSPNTNKPLHLGHIRNILLGWSCSKILEAAGYEVVKVQIVNDRGIAICRSMLAWQKFGESRTPESAGIKGDHFVGHFYVQFAREFEEEYALWQSTEAGKRLFEKRKKQGQSREVFFDNYRNDYFNEFSKLGKEAREMLRKWESNDPSTRALWQKMNAWVLSGFEETYNKLGVSFDKLYFESDTYLLGKELIEEGLRRGIFQREGKRVWVDLENIGLGVKTIIKSDGTSTYTSQDLGTAHLRYKDYGIDKMVYVVGDEQISHFQGLFEILKRLGEPYANGLYHLAYGMVDLPSGKMKSREGKVVDADDLIAEVIGEARENARERGEIADLPKEEQEAIIRKIALAALKFFILKVHPKKRMTFDPKESVDMQGQTGPYIQNAFVRIQSVLRKAGDFSTEKAVNYSGMEKMEKNIIAQVYEFPEVIISAAEEYEPSNVANYCYNLARAFHRFYHDHSILKAKSEEAKAFRLQLSQAVAKVLKSGMELIGIEMPDRM